MEQQLLDYAESVLTDEIVAQRIASANFTVACAVASATAFALGMAIFIVIAMKKPKDDDARLWCSFAATGMGFFLFIAVLVACISAGEALEWSAAPVSKMASEVVASLLCVF